MTTQQARSLRRSPTDAELRLWQSPRRCRFAGHKFRRQRPIGTYIVDFVCLEQRLIIEVDGSRHRGARDAVRDEQLRGEGFRVLRFSDTDVLTQLDSVEQVVWDALQERQPADPLPHPPPEGGGDDRAARAASPSPRLDTAERR